MAWWEASFLAVYIAMIGCVILYGLRVISQLGERDDPAEFDVE